MAASSSSSRKRNVQQAFGDIEAVPERESRLASPQLYDVFISHRGPDVKHTLASQLYRSLQKRRCRAFLDSEEIKGGDSISSTIENAICSSLVQVAIFSKRFAESKWCLDELLLMLQQSKALFIPVFYEVEPWELRYIEKGVYAAAFSEYERKRRNLNKLDDWKSALQHASDFSGYELSKYGEDLCGTIVSAVVERIEARRPLHVATHPVGLDERVKDFDIFCGEHKNIITIGIFGLGGSGKTTLAKELLNRKRSNYNASCFLNDVREASAKGELHSMQTKLLKDLFRENCKFDNVDEGTSYLRDRLRTDVHLRFLIVLDDIDHQDQLEALSLRDMQSPGNLVIVTTRDERVLTRARISVHYRMKGLDMPQAIELFCMHAFLQPYPDIGYEDLVVSFVKFCAGLPLSLKVLGSHVSGGTTSYWMLELEKVRKILPNDIIQRLKISFDSLDGDEKQIFMDIACFFIGRKRDIAIRIWKGSGWSAEHALQTLRDKSLVEMEVNESVDRVWFKQISVFRMHDHLRDLGRRMAEELSPPRLWQPHHLRSMESKGFRKILAETHGRCFHGFKDSSIDFDIKYFIGNTNDCAETSTELLWLELKRNPYTEFKSRSFPSWIPLQKMQGLYVDCPLRGLWDYTQAHFELKELKLHWSPSLPNLPKLIGMLSDLESLDLVRLPWEDVVSEGTSFLQSLRKLRNLRKLVLGGVSITEEVALSKNSDSSTTTSMNRLQIIDMRRIEGLSKLLISGDACPSLQSLILGDARDLIEVDLKQLQRLNYISLSGCDKLKTISGLSDLTELLTLIIEKCPELAALPTLMHLRCLESITISGAPHKLQSIAGIEELEGLKDLHLCGVKGHVGVWNCIYGLKKLPSEITSVICVDTEKSILNANLFCGVIDGDSVNEIDGIDCVDRKLKISGAIILCLQFRCVSFGHISTPWLTIPITFKGEGIVTIVVTHQKKIDRFVPSLPYGAKLHCKGYMVTVREGEEWKTLEIFKRIIGQVYLGLKGIR